jgi:hypothetical protein
MRKPSERITFRRRFPDPAFTARPGEPAPGKTNMNKDVRIEKSADMRLQTGNHLYVALSRSATILSKIIHTVKNDEFTHAALALDSGLEYMFSFGRRYAGNPFIGCFRREHIGDAFYRSFAEVPGAVIELSVSPAQYENVTAQIEAFLSDSHMYGYNYLGLVGNLRGISLRADRRFFCSEFVYHVLYESGICDFKKPRGLVCPQDLMNIKGRVVFRGNLKEYDSLAMHTAARIPDFPI